MVVGTRALVHGPRSLRRDDCIPPPPSPLENGAVDRFSLIGQLLAKGHTMSASSVWHGCQQFRALKKGLIGCWGSKCYIRASTPAALVLGGRSQTSWQCGCSCGGVTHLRRTMPSPGDSVIFAHHRRSRCLRILLPVASAGVISAVRPCPPSCRDK